MLLGCAIGRTMRGWAAAWGISMIGVASHLLLDWTNTYGIRLLFPFSSQWFHLDLINLFDLFVWAVLLLGWLGPMVGKLVSGEIGAQAGTGRGMAIFALSFFLIYDFGRFLSHQRAIEILNSRVYRDGPPFRAAAFPTGAVNPLEWQGLDRAARVCDALPVNVLKEFDPTAGAPSSRPPPSPAIEAAAKLARWRCSAVCPISSVVGHAAWTLSGNPKGARDVELTDWRFPFSAQALVDSSNRVISSSFGLGANRTGDVNEVELRKFEERSSWKLSFRLQRGLQLSLRLRHVGNIRGLVGILYSAQLRLQLRGVVLTEALSAGHAVLHRSIERQLLVEVRNRSFEHHSALR